MADGGQAIAAAPELVDARAIASAARRTKRAIELRAARERWPFQAVRGNGGTRRLYPLDRLPPDVRAAITLHHARAQSPEAPRRRSEKEVWSEAQREAAWEAYARRSDADKAMAQRRQGALVAVAGLVAGGLSLMAARREVAAQLAREGVRGASVASLCRWADAVRGVPRDSWVTALLPRWSGAPPEAEIPQEAWDAFVSDWLRPAQPSAAGCYDRLERVAAVKGWKLPSVRTFLRRLETIPPPVRILAREGEEALLRSYPAQQRDRGVFAAGEAVNADGHKFDVFVRFPNGAVGRPIIVAIQCLNSGKLLGWRVGDAEGSDLVRLAFADVIRRVGIMRCAYLDNGRGFAAKMLTGGTRTRFRFKVRDEDPVGILVGLGVELHWATPYHGQSKPIERAFLDLCDRIAKHPACQGAYTGNKPTTKPEDYASKALSWDAFVSLVETEIAAHNARPGRRSKVCAGRSFDQAFAESYRQATVRKATPEQLRSLLLAAEAVTANRTDGSVALLGNRYWHEALAPHAGQPLVVRFDPDHLHQPVAVYTLAGAYLCDAECIAAVGFADQAAAREHARARKQYRRAAKDQLAATRRMTAAQVAAQLPSTPPAELPEARVIEGVFRAQGARAPKPAEAAMAATGTDGASPQERRLADLTQRLMEQRIQEMGWQPPGKG